MEIFAEYIRIRQPDRDKLAELVLRAKGEGRTMKQFAQACGVNPSTLSRIVNKKTSSANSDALIDAIYKNAAPESGITLELLLDAHGMVPKLRNGRTKRFELSLLEKDIQDVMFEELITRGFTVGLPKKTIVHSALNYPHKTDYAVYTDALGGTKELWEFEIWTLAFQESYTERDVQKQVMKIRQKILVCLGMMYMNEMDCKRLSFLITEEEVYQKTVESLENCKIPKEISLIHVNLEEHRMEKEYRMPLLSGEDSPSILDTPRMIQEEDEIENEEQMDVIWGFADHDIL